jgi:hypothetical protein
MHLFGLVALGYMWARIAETVHAKLATGAGDAERLKNKLVVGRFFAERMLPETATHLTRIQNGASTMMELPAEAFYRHG